MRINTRKLYDNTVISKNQSFCQNKVKSLANVLCFTSRAPCGTICVMGKEGDSSGSSDLSRISKGNGFGTG